MITKTKVLRFEPDVVQKPIVCHLARKFDLTFSILKAKVLPRQVGLMILELSGEDENFHKGIAYLEESGITVDSIEQEVLYDPDICTQCGACTGFCPSDALRIKDRVTMEVEFVSDNCIGCELCLFACPSRALRLAGQLLI